MSISPSTSTRMPREPPRAQTASPQESTIPLSNAPQTASSKPFPRALPSNSFIDTDFFQSILFKSSIVSDSWSTALMSLQTTIDKLHAEMRNISARLDHVVYSNQIFPPCSSRSSSSRH